MKADRALEVLRALALVPEWAEQGWLPVAACEIPHKTFPRNAMDAAAKSVATSPMTLSAA